MSIADLFWLFFVLSALQPVLQRRMLEAARTRLLHDRERKRRSRVIALIHRQETMSVSVLGFPFVRYLDIEDSEAILRAIQLTPSEMPVDLILHTPGGLVLAAEQVTRAAGASPFPYELNQVRVPGAGVAVPGEGSSPE
jgi:ClpP class serine protease